MSFSAMRDVVWSDKAQSCKDVMTNHSAPLLVKVEQGYCSEEDGESLGQGQIIRIRKWLKKQRVIATDSRGRHFSFPIEFPVPFEILSEKKKTLTRKRTKTLAEIVKSHTLPKTVQLKSTSAKSAEFAIASAFGREPLELLRIHEDIYLNGNAVNYGSIDPTIINLPIHASLELTVGEGIRNGGDAQWKKLLKDLDAAIAKEARVEPSRGHQKILVFMPARGDDDDDVLLTQDTTRSTTSTEDGDDVIRSYDGKDDPDRDSTGGSASGGSTSHSMSSNDVLLNGDDHDGGGVSTQLPQRDMVDFTSYTQKSSFMLEHGGMTPADGRAVVDLEGFFDEQKSPGNGELPEERSMFKSNVSKLSFLRPQHWGYAGSEPATTQNSENAAPASQENGGRRNSEGNTGTYTKRNSKLSKHAKKILTKQSSQDQQQQPPKDVGPKKRLRRLSAVPTDTYALSAQQVLDLLKLLDLSDFAPMFAFDRIDGRVLSKLNLDELTMKYGMTEEHAMKLLAQVNKQDLGKEDDRSISSYQTTNGALDVDYSEKTQHAGNLTSRYF